MSWRNLDVDEEGVSKAHGFKYFLVSIIDEEETGQQFCAIISEQDGEYMVDATYDDEEEAYDTWNRWTR